MQQKTGTRIQIPSQPTPGMPNRVATVTGPSDGCHLVKSHIERMITEQSSQSVMAGTGAADQQQGMHQTGMQGGQNQYAQYGAYAQQYQAGAGAGAGAAYGQQQQNAYAQYGAYGQQAQQQNAYSQYGAQPAASTYTQQPAATTTGTAQKTDYSQEWAAYYASQAQQQGGATATASTTPAAPAPAPVAAAAQQTATAATSAIPASQDPTAYYDQFFRYALYYGEEAARKTYGAWAPPVGTPNPYGNASATAPAGQPQSS